MVTPDEGFTMRSSTNMGSDPWSDLTWGDKAMNVTLETDIFDFEAVENKSAFGQQPNDFESISLFFPSDPWKEGGKRSHLEGLPKVQVAIHEQVSATYDEISREPTCQVDGSIVVKPSSQTPATKPFCLVVRDLFDKIENLELKGVCTNVSKRVENRKDIHKSDTILKVRTPSASELETEIPVATYTCNPSLRPVPLLVKSRVQKASHYRRVGFKIRSNPHNKSTLQQIVIMLAVPPCVDGPSVKMSREGGIWDEMKRTVSWIVDSLNPGEAIEVQAQFEAVEGSSQEAQFPVMIRAEYPALFSGIDVTTADIASVGATSISMKLHQSARVLHRKI